jgi:uncharacterized membrane-anchored protein YjiN (DUF445 family)
MAAQDPATPVEIPSAADDEAKSAALRRTRMFATLTLLGCFGLFLAARALETRWPALAYVAAFAEAATIGGLADWYAVVALFRRPLGLPIPHTAIIPANQDRIADNLGRFIESNFLAPEPVRRKLREVDFARLVAEWLSDPGRSRGLARFAGRLAPQALAAVEESGFGDVAARRLREQINKVQIAPLAADMLATLTADGRHQRILDELLQSFASFLKDKAALASLRDRIRDELPTLANFFRADTYLLRKIVASAATLIDEVKADPDHSMRREFDRFAAGFVEELRTSPDYAERAERLKQDLLARPELREIAVQFWVDVRSFVERDIASADSVLIAHLTNMFVEIGRQLAEDTAMRRDMNEGFVVALSQFIESQKSGVAGFISDQVRSWDLGQLTRLLELNVGRDLQYIRFNGMLIGGLAGLTLHIGERLLFGN